MPSPLGQPTREVPLSEMSTNEISKKIRDMYQLRRDCRQQISRYNDIFQDAGNIIDCCEKELMRRGHK